MAENPEPLNQLLKINMSEILLKPVSFFKRSDLRNAAIGIGKDNFDIKIRQIIEIGDHVQVDILIDEHTFIPEQVCLIVEV